MKFILIIISINKIINCLIMDSLILDALKQLNFGKVIEQLKNLDLLDVTTATTIIEYILKNFNRSNWQYKNDYINRTMTQVAEKLNFQECTKLLIDNIFKLLILFHHLKIATHLNTITWATSIFQQIDKTLLTELEISEDILLDMIGMQHCGVFELLIKFNVKSNLYVINDTLKFLKKSCNKNGKFNGNNIMFLIESFYIGDITMEIGVIILSAIRYDADAYEGQYDEHKIIRELITTIISKTQNVSYSSELLNHLLAILTKHYYVEKANKFWSDTYEKEKKDRWIIEHNKIDYWREESIMFLLQNKKINENIEYNTFENCINNKCYKFFLIFSLCSPREVSINTNYYRKELKEIEDKINGKKYEILKKYHIFCYLNIMCDLVGEPYDINIIWYLMNVNELIFDDKECKLVYTM